MHARQETWSAALKMVRQRTIVAAARSVLEEIVMQRLVALLPLGSGFVDC